MPTLRKRLKLRWPYLMMYLCLTVTGILVAVAPSPAARDQLRMWLPVWVVFFIVGGSSSSVGIFVGRWFGEAFGLPLLSSSLVIYSIILMFRFSGGLTAPLLAFVFMIMGFGLGLFGRWLEVLKLLRAARETKEHGR